MNYTGLVIFEVGSIVVMALLIGLGFWIYNLTRKRQARDHDFSDLQDLTKKLKKDLGDALQRIQTLDNKLRGKSTQVDDLEKKLTALENQPQRVMLNRATGVVTPISPTRDRYQSERDIGGAYPQAPAQTRQPDYADPYEEDRTHE